LEILDKYSDFNAQGLKIFLNGFMSQTLVDLSLILFNQAASLEIMQQIKKANCLIDFLLPPVESINLDTLILN
jgi:hypothetical protein